MDVCRVLLSRLEALRISWPLEAVCGNVWVLTLPSCKWLSSSTAYSPSTGTTILLFQRTCNVRLGKFRTIRQVNVVLTWTDGKPSVEVPWCSTQGCDFQTAFTSNFFQKIEMIFLEKELLLAELKAWLCFASNSARYILIHRFSPHSNWTKSAFVAFSLTGNRFICSAWWILYNFDKTLSENLFSLLKAARALVHYYAVKGKV